MFKLGWCGFGYEKNVNFNITKRYIWGLVSLH
jgi:hypothetical protein